MKRLLATILLLFICVISIAQVKERSDADKLFEKRDYAGAVKQYKKALRKSKELKQQQEIAYQIAIAYYSMNDYRNAIDWFEDAIGDHINDPETYIMYSQVLTADRNYSKAKSILQEAEKVYPDFDELKDRIYALNIIVESRADSSGIVQKVKMINSPYSDYSAAYWKDGLVFSSARKDKGNQRTDGRTGQGFSDLYYSEFDISKASHKSPSVLPSKVNSSDNDGVFTYDSKNHIAYWTRCTSKPGKCQIYFSTYNSVTNKWSKAEKVEFMNKEFDYGHPFINEDGSVLYFTSNMPGGYGKNDIWKVKRKTDGFWGVPVNLGKEVNSAKDEVFPTMYGDTLLFFSSDYKNTYGGLDLYFSILNGVTFSNPVNIGLPINSAADDFSLIFREGERGGYFTSNRDVKSSDDIYSFSGFPIKIMFEGNVYHEADGKPIDNSMIVYVGQSEVFDTTYTDEKGYFKIYLDAYDKYLITVSADNFFNHEQVFETESAELIFKKPPQIVKDINLSMKSYPCGISGLVTNRETGEPMMGVLVSLEGDSDYSTFVKTDFRGGYSFNGLKPDKIYTIRTGKNGYFSESRVCKLPKVNRETVFSRSNGYDMDFQLLKIQTKTEVTLSNIYYDLNKATLRETSKIELNKLASMIKETPGIVIQINAHTDERGRAEYNMKLSAERANSVVNYLVLNGVERNRLIAKGFGETMLLIENATNEDEHQANRRTTFSVVTSESNKDVIERVSPSKEEIMLEEAGEVKESSKSPISGLKYNIQLITTGTKRNPDTDFANILNSISDIEIIEIEYGTLWKYEAGTRSFYQDALNLRDKLKCLGYDDCFVVPYYNGSKIPVDQAKIMEEER